MKQQVLVIHGGNAFDSYDEYLEDLKKKEIKPQKLRAYGWKNNLGNVLGENFDVITPEMPNAQNAKYLEWKIWFEKIIPYLENGLILIGHSLGGIFLAKYLSENKFPKRIKALILVAPPYNTAKIHPLADFNLTKPLNNLSKQIDKIILFQSRDDKIVPFANSKHYKNEIPNLELIIFENRGHFSEDEFPEIVEKIKLLRKS